ncbi:eukaryotic translation initiation factor 5-like [Aristolochia californica]|uniref:eukaryotic translation initiation factor 5-like n=1 Tax=Aristolochia californica TaxID=171875 RepID=UPI0035DE5E37
MALQNIGSGNKDDAFYRYKMPKMVTKIEGRGNGIKTNVVNMVDIAKALARPASYTTKYFGCELGAQSKFDEKTGVSLVNGAHDTAKLAALLENFIKKYVQCYGCGNPETEIVITKTQMITLKCAACGYVSDVDMRNKLTTFILKNPPEQKKGGKDKKAMRRAEKERLKEGEVADEELKKLKKEVKKKTSKEAPASKISKKKSNGSDEDRKSPSGSQADDNEMEMLGDDEEDDGIQWQTDTSREAAQRRIQEQLNAATAEMVILSTHEPEEKKPKPNKKATSPTKEANGENNDLSVETIISEIKVNLKRGSTPSQFKSFLGSLSADPQDVLNALFQALFRGVDKGFAKDVEKKKAYLAAAVQEDGSQVLLLRSIESFCRDASADAVKEVPLVLKVLYDADILKEEYIMQWFHEGLTGGTKKSPIWKNLKPFIEWLQNAESESEEE